MENKIQKAINVFEKPSKHIKCVHKCENGMEFFSYSQDLVAAFETAISALEKQIPKKYKKTHPCKSVTYYQCPCCDGLLHINENFCGECGQAIDWGD